MEVIKFHTDKNHIFSGPFFIIGMPRSGTKLLRGLLNQHSRVGIPDIETNFLPIWVNEWSTYGDVSDRQIFQRFYQKMLRFTYFRYKAEWGELIEPKTWHQWCREYTLGGVFEALIRHDADVEYDSGKVWGDKSPTYISHIPILKLIFPNARLIHIVRDVRDYCLSVNKAWGKNMVRAAQRWADAVEKARDDGRRLKKDYIEVKYEDLISHTDSIIKTVCDFLDIESEPQMLCLSKPCEPRGDARGKEINRSNKEKYLKLMNYDLRMKIESLTAQVLRLYDYPIDYFGAVKRLGGVETFYYKMMDGVSLFRYSVTERGLLNTVKWNLLKRSRIRV